MSHSTTRTFSHQDVSWSWSDFIHGLLAVRERSAKWCEALLLVDKDPTGRGAFDVVSAVCDAMSFVTGRRTFWRGYEDIGAGQERRYLSADAEKAQRNRFDSALGADTAYLSHAELLLGRAVGFFMTDVGRTAAQYLRLYWDTVDNQFDTRLAVAGISLEGLLRLASGDKRENDLGASETDRNSLLAWLDEKADHLTPEFVKRLRGFVNSLGRERPEDILWSWEKRSFLAVKSGDIQAWKTVRHPAAHGQLTNRSELQVKLDSLHTVASLVNRVILHMMNYEGPYVDYSQPGWPEVQFPLSVPRSTD